MNQASTTGHPDRDLRQRDLVPPERLAACHAVVIGVGAIGRQAALQLAAVGVPRLTLFDDDDVRPENLAVQGYWAEDLGTSKVLSTLALCRRINPDVQAAAVVQRFKRSTAKDLPGDRLVVFACVDAITTRRRLWESLRNQAAFFVDGRMSAEVIRGRTGSAAQTPAGARRTANARSVPSSCTPKASLSRK